MIPDRNLPSYLGSRRSQTRSDLRGDKQLFDESIKESVAPVGKGCLLWTE